MARRVPARLTAAEGRRFACTVGGAFLVLGALAWWRGRLAVAGGLAAVGALLLLLGVAVPARLGPVNRAWMGLATALSKVTTPIFMGVIFFAIITPMGMLMRLFRKAPLGARPGTGTRWHARTEGERRSRLERQF